MANQNEKRNPVLYIPNNVSTKSEIFQGFGKTELGQSIIGVIIVLILASIIYSISKNGDFITFFILFGIASSVMATIKDKYNQSIVGYIQDIIKFYTTQQKYRYKFKNEWGDF